MVLPQPPRVQLGRGPEEGVPERGHAELVDHGLARHPALNLQRRNGESQFGEPDHQTLFDPLG